MDLNGLCSNTPLTSSMPGTEEGTIELVVQRVHGYVLIDSASDFCSSIGDGADFGVCQILRVSISPLVRDFDKSRPKCIVAGSSGVNVRIRDFIVKILVAELGEKKSLVGC
jgi:hypothetical protein